MNKSVETQAPVRDRTDAQGIQLGQWMGRREAFGLMAGRSDGFQLFFQHLLLSEGSIVPSGRNQAGMSSLLDDAALLEHDDAAGLAYRGDAVGDQDDGAAAHCPGSAWKWRKGSPMRKSPS